MLSVKFVKKWIFIIVLNLNNMLLSDISSLKRCKKKFVNLEVEKKKKMICAFIKYLKSLKLKNLFFFFTFVTSVSERIDLWAKKAFPFFIIKFRPQKTFI